MDNQEEKIATDIEARKILSGFICNDQMDAINCACAGEEGEFFEAKLIEMATTIATMPQTYQTDGQGDEATAHLHYFINNCNFYITEKDQEAEQLQAFGLADLGYGGELGYISLVEILSCGAELDLFWTKKTIGEIKEAQNALNASANIATSGDAAPLIKGERFRIRPKGSKVEWTVATVLIMSDNGRSCGVSLDGMLRAPEGGFIGGNLPLVIDKEAGTIKGLFGESYEIEVMGAWIKEGQ